MVNTLLLDFLQKYLKPETFWFDWKHSHLPSPDDKKKSLKNIYKISFENVQFNRKGTNILIIDLIMQLSPCFYISICPKVCGAKTNFNS